MTVADALSTQKPDRDKLGLEHPREFVDRDFSADLHALRVLSLANGVSGVLNTAVLSSHAIGQAYANVAKITAKSGVKQIDRMLGNDALSLDIVLARWVRFVCRPWRSRTAGSSTRTTRARRSSSADGST
ncbi:hypothetical protein [Sorangium sp. So ce394]|uniref:hypothetical protein n=1 Tax=Sorangium sp. So ce394 TaxID=3133310 RepID=UPI003F5B69CD